MGLIIWWRESGEVRVFARRKSKIFGLSDTLFKILTSEIDETHREELYRAFWANESNTKSFYKKTGENVLFRVRVRAKFLLGLVRADTVSEASFIVSGKISWAIKDILA